MSILVVNSLKHSTGSSPTLTWPTADGTDGQVLQSSNNAGNLVFGGAQLEAQNGTNITFPASAADNTTFITDANGALTATVAGSNPMNTPDNAHQGERLLDRYVISGGGSPASSINLTVPSGYTSTDLNTIRNFRVVVTGLGVTSGGVWRAVFTPLIGKAGGSANTNFFSAGNDASSEYHILGAYGRSSTTSSVQTYQASNQSFTSSTNTIYRTDNSASSGKDFFVNEATSSDLNYNGSNSLLFGEVTCDCNTMPMFLTHMQFERSAQTGNYSDDVGMYCSRPTTKTEGNNDGRHTMGIKISNTTGVNFTTGLVEMYGTFKDGVVS